ncbi:MAG: hypothetical protein IJ488_03370 [Clostridia bacterium]|nr:hypothetical protein [Clostridia bacterium]
MKQRKTSKLIILALSLALLIGSAVGIAVSANEATAPTILSKNVAADGNFCLMFAVDPATCAGEDVTLTVYNTNPEGLEGDALASATVQTITKPVTDTQPEDLDGNPETAKTDVLVFTTKGVAAKDIADEWYITVESGDLSTTEKYSVREYAFERLYKDQTILAAGGTYEYRQKQFYLSILAVGSTAQDLLVNAELEAGATPERLANEYSYAAITKGSFSGDLTGTYGFVEIGDSLTLTEDAGFTDPSWKVYTYGTNGALDTVETVALGSTIEITGNTVVVPGWAEGKTPGKYFGDLGDDALAFDGSESVPNAISLNTTTTPKDGYHKIIADTGRGNVLVVGKTDYTWVSGDVNSPALTATIVDKANENGNTLVIEMDIKIDLTYTNYNSASEYSSRTTAMNRLDIFNGSGTSISNWNHNCVETSGTLSADSPLGGDIWNINGSGEFEYGKWYNLCIEILEKDTTYNKVTIYIDGEYFTNFNIGASTGYDIYTATSFKFTWQPRTVAETHIDNLFVGIVEK